jgi:hypothetical protein
MPMSISFCLDRAEEAAEEARRTPLENVRERALRSEAVWREMAERAREIQDNRDRKAQSAALSENAEHAGETSPSGRR